MRHRLDPQELLQEVLLDLALPDDGVAQEILSSGKLRGLWQERSHPANQASDFAMEAYFEASIRDAESKLRALRGWIVPLAWKSALSRTFMQHPRLERMHASVRAPRLERMIDAISCGLQNLKLQLSSLQHPG